LEEALCEKIAGSQTQQVVMCGVRAMCHALAGLPNASDIEPQVFLLSLDFSFVTLSFHQEREK
jgi:hypothetical protein